LAFAPARTSARIASLDLAHVTGDRRCEQTGVVRPFLGARRDLRDADAGKGEKRQRHEDAGKRRKLHELTGSNGDERRQGRAGLPRLTA
jgi:hypothetical protein